MSDSKPNQNQPQIGIQKIYTKDVSFESPNTPVIFKETWKPDANVELSNKATKLEENIFEVILSITVTVKIEEKIAYLTEVHQAGIFMIKGFDDKALDEILGSYCPGILFPFSRENIANLIQKGGFQPFYLQPIDFNAIYAQSRNQENAGDNNHLVKH